MKTLLRGLFYLQDVLYVARDQGCMDAGIRVKQEARAEESEAKTHKECLIYYFLIIFMNDYSNSFHEQKGIF